MDFILILSLLFRVGKCVFVDKHNDKINITNTSLLSMYVCMYKGEVEVSIIV